MYAIITPHQDEVFVNNLKFYKDAGIKFKGNIQDPDLGLCFIFKIVDEKKFNFTCIKLGIFPKKQEIFSWQTYRVLELSPFQRKMISK